MRKTGVKQDALDIFSKDFPAISKVLYAFNIFFLYFCTAKIVVIDTCFCS